MIYFIKKMFGIKVGPLKKIPPLLTTIGAADIFYESVYRSFSHEILQKVKGTTGGTYKMLTLTSEFDDMHEAFYIQTTFVDEVPIRTIKG